jgi:hypothetical protein
MVSLLIAGSAHAGSGTDDAAARAPDASAGVVRVFGTTLCLSNAPLDAQCDWRFPAPKATRPDPASREFTLFGKRFCASDAAGPCDVRFPVAPARPAKTVQLFGLTWCFGDTSPASGCDLTLPSVPPPDQSRARL